MSDGAATDDRRAGTPADDVSDAALVPVADGVYVLPADPDPRRVQPNVGVVVTAAGAVVIDGGNSPAHARRVRDALAALTALPVVFVVYTHHHWDHVFGAQTFGAPAIAHTLAYARLIERAERPWSAAYVEEEARRNPALAFVYNPIAAAMRGDWEGFRLVVPSITFERRLTLHLTSHTLDLVHVGGQHADDSILAVVRESGVAFLGDSYYKPPPYARQPGATFDGVLLRRLIDDAALTHYIDGHTPRLLDKAALAAVMP